MCELALTQEGLMPFEIIRVSPEEVDVRGVPPGASGDASAAIAFVASQLQLPTRALCLSSTRPRGADTFRVVCSATGVESEQFRRATEFLIQRG